MKKILFLLCFCIFSFLPRKVFALNEVNIYFFHSDNCDICKQEKVYLEALKERYPNMRVYAYEISDPTNYQYMLDAKEMFQQTGVGVPFTVIGDSAYYGFSEARKGTFQKQIYEYSNQKYKNELGQKLGITYRTDLEGTVQDYKENDSYQVEESSGISRKPAKNQNIYDKYKVSFYLVIAGIILSIIAFVLYQVDKRRMKQQ